MIKIRSIIATLFVFMLLLSARHLAAETPAVFPREQWLIKPPAEVGLDEAKLRLARDYALTGNGAGYVVRHGYRVMQWGDVRQRFDLKSTTKSIGATALGVAILDAKLSLDDLAVNRHPSFGTPPETNRETGWLDKITLRHLATQTAGFEKPGGYTKLLFEPGSQWGYSDGGPNWLAECVALAYRRDVAELMFERVFTPIGITRDDLRWRENSYRPKELDGRPRREFGSGVSANVDAMARLGYLHLRGGDWNGKRLLPREFVDEAGRPAKEIAGLTVVDPEHYGKASNHYGLLWWNNGDGTLETVPRDAFWSWGLYDSLIVVIPSLDMVIARAGQSWKRADGADHYEVLKPFLGPIATAVTDHPQNEKPHAAKDDATKHPPSPAIAGIEWSPAAQTIRRAKGSDNWPITWSDDDALYTAYGDGRGFEPFVPKKLSLGLARVTGAPPDLQGINILSPTAESVGDDVKGRKASGLLMVDGVLYLLARNCGNSQLGWSRDRGQSWTWADWKFDISFGCPTFLNFGRNYEGARDGFVYIYSHDNDSAYQRADRMVLGRVPRDQLPRREAYEFFARLASDGMPEWTRDIERRGAVFTSSGRCYRSSVSYNGPLRRYLWCQTGLGEDTRFRGGLAIYDAPEPWGPWTSVFETDEWDIGPGETSSFPTKWISRDGRSLSLAFSGDDSFSVRQATLRLRDAETSPQTSALSERPRLLVLTDIGGDPDDQQSLIRLMVHANEFDIEGLIASASGTIGELKEQVTKPQLIREIVDAYGQVRENLARHADGFPETARVREVIKSGNSHRGRDAIGEGHDTEGSRWIIECADRRDSRRLNIVIWGGQTDFAQALWRIRHERGDAGLKAFAAKVRIYDTGDQDRIADWMLTEFPGLFYILARPPAGRDRREAAYRGMYLGGDESLVSRDWMESNIRQHHGPLGALYPPDTWTAPNPHSAIKEGDTPSWFFFLPVGPGDAVHPEWGGWGGRFLPERDHIYRDAKDQVGDMTDARSTVSRWRSAFQNEFAARLDWCVKLPAEANRPPRPVLNGKAGRETVSIAARPGRFVELSSAGSTDPDGNELRTRWWVYPEASSYQGEVKLADAETAQARVTVPADAAQRTIHVILELRDDGSPAMTRYRRAVIQVDGE